MQVASALLIAWFVLVGMWVLNHYFNANKKYELDYRAGKHVREREGESAYKRA